MSDVNGLILVLTVNVVASRRLSQHGEQFSQYVKEKILA